MRISGRTAVLTKERDGNTESRATRMDRSRCDICMVSLSDELVNDERSNFGCWYYLPRGDDKNRRRLCQRGMRYGAVVVKGHWPSSRLLTLVQ